MTRLALPPGDLIESIKIIQLKLLLALNRGQFSIDWQVLVFHVGLGCDDGRGRKRGRKRGSKQGRKEGGRKEVRKEEKQERRKEGMDRRSRIWCGRWRKGNKKKMPNWTEEKLMTKLETGNFHAWKTHFLLHILFHFRVFLFLHRLHLK